MELTRNRSLCMNNGNKIPIADLNDGTDETWEIRIREMVRHLAVLRSE
jgi:hypothetical protein